MSQDPSKPSQLWKESLYSLLVKVARGGVPKVCWNNLRVWRLGNKKRTQMCCDLNCREWTVLNCCTTSWPYNKTCGNKVDYTLKSSIQHIVIIKDLYLFIKNMKLTQKSSQDQDQIHPFFQPTTKKDPSTPLNSKDWFMNVHTLAIRSSESFNIPPGKPKNFLRKARGCKEAKAWLMVNLPFPDPGGPLWTRPALWSGLGWKPIGFP